MMCVVSGSISLDELTFGIRGVQRGEAPLRFFVIPQEWGTKGVEAPRLGDGNW